MSLLSKASHVTNMILLAMIALATFAIAAPVDLAAAVPRNFTYVGFQSRHTGCPKGFPEGTGSLGITICYLVTSTDGKETPGYMEGCLEFRPPPQRRDLHPRRRGQPQRVA